jgi:phenylacetate-CoA ligase
MRGRDTSPLPCSQNSWQRACACAKRPSVLAKVEGRADDVLYAADGRCIGRLDPVFKGTLPIRDAQIIQESFSLIRFRYVPGKGYKPADGGGIVAELQARLGPMEVVLEEVAEVPGGRMGSFGQL